MLSGCHFLVILLAHLPRFLLHKNLLSANKTEQTGGRQKSCEDQQVNGVEKSHPNPAQTLCSLTEASECLFFPKTPTHQARGALRTAHLHVPSSSAGPLAKVPLAKGISNHVPVAKGLL